MNGSDDVIYICTRPRSGGSTALATTTSTGATGSRVHCDILGQAPRTSCPRACEPSSILNSTHSRGRRLGPKSRLALPLDLTVPSRLALPRVLTVPHEIRNKCVRLGWAPKDGGEKSQEVQLARREFQRVVRRAKRQYWRILIDGFSDSASVYKAVRWLKSPGAFQPPPLQIGDDVYETQLDKANVLGHSTLERRTVADNIADPWILVLPARKIPFAQTGNTSPGADNITVKLLQAAWDITGGHVCRLYQGCLTVGHHPGVFREAEVAMIPKPGKRNLSPPRVWRPISLLYCPGEGLERMIARQLACASIYYAVLHPQQASALPKRSAVDLVAVLTPIELWDDSVLKIQFWRIPRTLNAIADDAAKQAARKVDGPDEYCEIKGVLT
ncbi:reverse transcriptase, RNaseH [Metarhizium robertsii ARSEF 23]|uniref:Reverse transcriptase, RNaseH n=1 Tax=Metarhizium robertsii (strain ARSEF 23 / ATCC MYA-3075) TaxID=655844 RepID=E9FA08_METRA|nr:reverse transcriptase, RNaseH [Metarhizium robertsii ARSEF 23]EFY95406.2 reverse transcriptase, RNaseH [Metarhizium robertsii ARSEF 23]